VNDLPSWTPAPHGDAAARRGAFILAALVSVAGLALAANLTVGHFSVSHGSGSASCPLAGIFDCDRVASSRYSELSGTPVALLGEALFLAALGLAAFGTLASAEARARAAAALFTLALFATAFSGWLLYVSAFRLGALCSLCVGLDVVVLLLLGTAAAAVRPSGVARVARVPGTGEAWAALAVGVIAVLVFQGQHERERRRVEDALLADFEVAYARSAAREVPSGKDRPSVGPEAAPVTIAIFSDFRCSGCRRVAEMLEQIRRGFPDEVRVVFRHFPLATECNPTTPTNMHPDACRAARAAEAAHEQGRFWDFHDRLFAVEGAIREETVRDMAAAVGLDVARFDERRASADVNRRIAEDAHLGRQLGLTGTPLVLVNGRRPPALRPEVLRRAVLYELVRSERGR
jgi:protein-disulfide isomerase